MLILSWQSTVGEIKQNKTILMGFLRSRMKKTVTLDSVPKESKYQVIKIPEESHIS